MSEATEQKRKTPVWIWVVGGIVALGLISNLFGGDDAETESAPAESETSEPISGGSDSEDAAEPEPVDPQPEPEPEPEPEREIAEDIVYSGAGDSVLRIELPGGPNSVGVASIQHSGSSNFAVWSLDQNLNQSDLLINEIGPYSGTVAFNLRATESITALEITADGTWEVTVEDLLTLPQLLPNSTAQGEGDDLLVYLGDTTIASVEHAGDSNFAVWSHGDYSDLLINEIGAYSGQVRWPAGGALIEITANGPWSIALD